MAHIKRKFWIVTEDGLEHEVFDEVVAYPEFNYEIVNVWVVIGETRFEASKMIAPRDSYFRTDWMIDLARQDLLDDIAKSISMWERVHGQ